MPELKNLFIKGKMNKDLDERLVPQGEYRDAQNIDVAFSEGSNVGAIEPIMGHTTQSGFFYNLTDAHCVGSVTDTETDKAYALVYSPSINIIVEYDIIANTKQIVLADEGTILNFSPERLVTGISVLDGVLYYTDNHTEPKQIDIEYWKSKSNLTATVASGASGQNTVTLTTDISTALSALIADGDVYFFGMGGIPQNVRAVSVSGATVTLSANLTTIGAVANTTAIFSILYTTENLSEDRITLIRKSPLNAPTFHTLEPSLRGGNGTIGGAVVKISFDFFPTTIDTVYTLTSWVADDETTSITPNWQTNDIILFKTNFINDRGIKYETAITMKKTGTNTYQLLTKSTEVNNGAIFYTVILEEEDPLFELKFPRFAYRYKYANGQYSAASPFSVPAFIPGDYGYTAKNGYNIGMTNTVRDLKLQGWPTSPSSTNYEADIEEIDVLYKDSVSPNVYIVDSIKKENNGFDSPFEIKDEQIFKAIQSNQILRPFDSIPRKAKALEITGNRLIFGNYLQNFNFIDTPTFTVITGTRADTDGQNLSIKSGRTYQLGITFKDEFGRETPVFTSKSGVIKIPYKNAELKQDLRVSTSVTPPSEATHYKYYIKEISNPYYNLAASNMYEEAETGHLYISFPSSEVNKVSEEDVLILKKGSGNSPFKLNDNKFKVLSKLNNPPDFLAYPETVTYSTSSVTFANGFGQGYSQLTKSPGLTPVPTHNAIQLEIAGTAYFDAGIIQANLNEVDDGFKAAIQIGSKIRFRRAGSSLTSKKYTVKSILHHDPGTTETEIIFEEQFGDDVNVIYLDNTDDSPYAAVIEKIESKADLGNPEYDGKFFIKLNNSAQLNQSLFEGLTEDQLFTIATHIDVGIASGDNDGGSDPKEYYTAYAAGANTTLGAITSIGSATVDIPAGFHLVISTEQPLNEAYHYYKEDPWAAAIIKENYFRFFNNSIFESGNTTIDDHPNFKIAEVLANEYGTAPYKYYAVKFTENLPFDISSILSSSSTAGQYGIDVRGFSDKKSSTPTNPPIFEVEPEDSPLEIYYETENSYPIAQLATTQTLSYTNCFSFGNGVESDRIRDDYNAPTLGKGVRVSTVFEDNYQEERLKTGLIFSGIYNSKNGVNRLNQFIIAENITKDLNPMYGSIKKLHTRDTDLVVLCEDKILKVLANKDALFNADGNVNITSNTAVLGQAIPFRGNYGCQHPESFANYTYKSYFVDKTRGKVLRLSLDGITEISNYGMRDFFSDICYSHSGYIHGSFDNYKNQYNVSFRVTPNSLDESVVDKTITFSESVNGWVSFKDYIQESGFSLNNRYVTFKDGDAYRHHNSGSSGLHGPAYKSSVTLLLNGNPGSIKNFRTLNYQGQDGWEADIITTDKQTGNISSFIEKEGIYYNYISGETQNTKASLDLKSLNVQGLGTPTNISSNDATFVDLNNAIQVGDKVFNNNNSDVRTVQSISGNTITLDAAPTNAFSYFAKDNRFNTSGILGYYAEIKMETKNNVNSGNRPELYSVGSEVSLSS